MSSNPVPLKNRRKDERKVVSNKILPNHIKKKKREELG
jgi:hypothetical protein